jgi:PAS domain S-box-containing protein
MNTTIKSKLFHKTLIVMILAFGIIALACSLVAGWILYDHLTSEYESKAVAIGNSITTSLPEIFLKNDAATDQSIIDQYLEIKGVAYALVKTEDGQIIAHTFSPEIPEDVLALVEKNTPHIDPRTGLMETQLLQTRDYLDVCSPILMGKAGYVHIGMDMGLINTYIFDAIIKMQVILFAVLIVCVIITFFFIRRIAKPLAGLAHYANQLAEQHFDAPVPMTSNDELGLLARTMQSMAQRINSLIQGLEAKIQNATGELQDTSLYLSTLVDNMADGLLVTDEKGEILNFNPAILKIFGLEHQELVQRSFSDLLDPTTLEHLQQQKILTYSPRFKTMEFDPHTLKTGIFQNELVTHKKDNTPLCLEFSMSSIMLKCGIQCIMVVRDITLRKQAQTELETLNNELEERVEQRTRNLETANILLQKEIHNRKVTEDALQDEKELFSTTLRTITDGVVTLDINGKVIFSNQAMERLVGWTAQEVRGKQFCSVFQITINGQTLYLDRSSQDTMAFNQLESEQDALVTTRDGQIMEIALRVLPLYDRRSEIKGQVLVIRDITAKKLQETERLKTEKLESIGILAGGIAHDFNNILTAVINYIILAKKDPSLGDIARNQLEKARKAGLRAQQLTQQLLTFSKGGAPIVELTGIHDLIFDSVTFALRGSNVKTTISISPDIWNAEVDPGQIAQVVENLAINADQAMPKGGHLEIAAQNVMVDKHSGLPLQAGQYIAISVTDEGPGIAPENLEKIFDPYFTTKKTGSGLGLATTYSIIKNHHGHIDVTSRPGHGTTFTIFLPASERQACETVVTPPPKTSAGQGTILLMDDDESIRDVMEETLGFLGYEVLSANDGSQALAIYEQHIVAKKRIDLVIMDLTIPGGMGGKETVGKLLDLDPDAKVIVSSGYSQDPVMADYEAYGFIDILAKPYTLEEVSRKISRILAQPGRICI